MRSETDIWDLENKWLNAFTETFVINTRRLVRGVAIDVDDDCVVVCGRARSYYAVQLAIHCAQVFNRDRPLFARTSMTFEIEHHSLELIISHQPHRAQVANESADAINCFRELTLVKSPEKSF